MARSGPGPEISRPAHSSTPSPVSSNPATRLSSVDFPQPEWPMMETNSPRSTARLMPLSAGNMPLRVENVMPTFSSCTYFIMGLTLIFPSTVLEAPRDQHQRLFEQQAHDPHDENRDDDVLDVKIVPFVPYPEA